MTEQDVADTLVAWLLDVLDDAALGADNGLKAAYPYINAEKGALPDVMADVREKRVGYGNDEPFFPLRELQQAVIRTFECQLSFMVEAGEGAAAASAETALLRAYGGAIEASILADASLGGRLSQRAFTSPIMRINYDTPFIQYPDGTRGRQMVATVAVGELVEDQR